MMTKQHRVENQKPQRRDGNNEGREASGNRKLRVGESKIAAHQQQNAHHADQGNLPWRIPDPASNQGTNSQHDDAGNRKPYSAHERRRNRLHRDVDSQVGGSPKYIDQPERKNDLPSIWLLGFEHDFNERRSAWVPLKPTALKQVTAIHTEWPFKSLSGLTSHKR